jgi:hypothetical protein
MREPMGAEQSEEELFVALGRAASKLWSNLPTETQQLLFEEAISSGGEVMRQPLAVFLHARHTRTTDALKAQALKEPDSPGASSANATLTKSSGGHRGVAVPTAQSKSRFPAISRS